MNRNRHSVSRDPTTRMVYRLARQSHTPSWLRTLHEIRGLGEIAA